MELEGQYVIWELSDPARGAHGDLKYHATPNCSALRGRKAFKEIIGGPGRSWLSSVDVCQRCEHLFRAQPSTPEEYRAEFEKIRARYIKKDADPALTGTAS